MRAPHQLRRGRPDARAADAQPQPRAGGRAAGPDRARRGARPRAAAPGAARARPARRRHRDAQHLRPLPGARMGSPGAARSRAPRPRAAPHPRGGGRRRDSVARHVPRARRSLRHLRLPAHRRDAVPADPRVRPGRRLARARRGPAHRSAGADRARVQVRRPVVPALDPRAGQGPRAHVRVRRLAPRRAACGPGPRARRPCRLRHAQPARAQAVSLGLRGQRGLHPRAAPGRGHGRAGDADRAPARRHRRAARADQQHVRRPEPGRPARPARRSRRRAIRTA